MRVLICGGRTFSDAGFLKASLDQFHAYYGFTLLIHGASQGADTLAANWALARGLPVKAFNAQWSKYGRRAGYIRNARMLEAGPKLVIAFPGGKGTQMMVRLAKNKLIETIEL